MHYRRMLAIVLLAISSSAFAAEFTLITAGADYLQNATPTSGIPWQVINAYRERREAVDGTLPDLPEAGDDVTRRSGTSPFHAWCNIQDWYYDNYDAWIATNPLPAAGTSNAPANYASLTEFYTAALMSTNGYRRATAWNPTAGDDWTVLDGGMWTNAGNGYGRIATDDIIGPWILDDLQRAASACIARMLTPQAAASGIHERKGDASVQNSYTYGESQAAALRALAVDEWTSATNSPTISAPYYEISRQHEDGLLGWKTWEGKRRHSTPTVTNIVTSLDYDWQAIFLPTTRSGYEWWDGDSKGWTNNIWVAHDSGSGSGASIEIAPIIGSATDTIPLDVTPALTWPAYTNQGVRVTYIRIIVSPQFTHTR